MSYQLYEISLYPKAYDGKVIVPNTVQIFMPKDARYSFGGLEPFEFEDLVKVATEFVCGFFQQDIHEDEGERLAFAMVCQLASERALVTSESLRRFRFKDMEDLVIALARHFDYEFDSVTCRYVDFVTERSTRFIEGVY